MTVDSKITARLLALLILAGSICLYHPLPVYADTIVTPDPIRVVVLRNSPPLQYFDENTFQASGFAVDLFDRVSVEIGLQYTYVYADTWSEMISMILEGQADIAASLGISKKRSRQLAFSEKIHSTPISMFVRAQNSEITGLSPGLRVATTEGSVVVNYLKRQKNVDVRLHKSVPEGVFALLAGRDDAFVAADWLVLKELRDANIEDRISMIEEPLFSIKRAMAVRPEDKILLKRLNQGISTLINSPEYRVIYVRWYGQPTSTWTVKRVLILMSVLLAFTVVILGGWRMLTARRLNQALRESEGRLREAMNATSDGLWDWDLKNEQVYFNSNYFKMLGYEPGEFTPSFDRWKELVHDEDRQRAVSAIQGHIENKVNYYETEYRMQVKNGNWRWILSRGEVTRRNASGRAERIIGTHVDITAKKRAEEALQKALQTATTARNRVDAILESVAEALIVTDINQQVVLMNKAAESMLGLSMDTVTGRSIETVFSEPALLKQIAILSKGRINEQRTDFDLDHADRGEKRHFQTQSSQVLTQTGVVTGTITLFRDVTEEKELDQMKNEFISIAAHELKTPLTAVIGYSELLLNESTGSPFDSGQRREFLTHILQKGEVLERLVDDLLNLSRIQSGRPLALDRQPCDLLQILRDIVPHHQRETELHTFKLDLPTASITLSLDRIRFEQAIDNLLSNARKYSPAGGTILISVHREQNEILITIEDEGIGMTPEQTEKVFEKFYRANTLNTAVQGLGLGMNIVKNIIEAHDGEILVNSTIGSGSKVFIRLTGLIDS